MATWADESLAAVEEAAAELLKLRPYGMRAVNPAIERANETFRALIVRHHPHLTEAQILAAVAGMVGATSKLVASVGKAQAAALRAEHEVLQGARPVAPGRPANDDRAPRK